VQEGLTGAKRGTVVEDANVDVDVVVESGQEGKSRSSVVDNDEVVDDDDVDPTNQRRQVRYCCVVVVFKGIRLQP
jgi:hypothetical protein